MAVLAPDHAGVDALALRARAHRVAAGEVEAVGVSAGNQIIGVGDEVVTCRNDRRLRTDKGTWVRNGQRWVVTARHPDSSLTVSSLDGAGDTVLARGYVGDHVRLSYALTVHKAQGLTVDRSILLADRRLSGEMAYVGLTRGRHENIACVVVEDDVRRRGLSTDPVEILGVALARSGTEPAATQVVRDQLARSEDLGELYPLLEQARAAVAALAGPDRSSEIHRLQRQVRSRPMIEDKLRSFSDRLGELEQELAQIVARRDELAPVLRAADERLRWRRPRREVVGAARAESDKLGQRRLEVLESRAQMNQRVARLGQDLAAADAAADRLPALEAEQADREQWLRSQPPEVVWVKELRRRIDVRTRELGVAALHDPPEHLVGLLGPPGTSLSRDEWAGAAGHVEAYRERWRLTPNELSRRPSRNSAQTKHRREVARLLPELQRRQARRVSREIDHGLTM